MNTISISSNFKQFTAHRLTDQAAFLIVLFSFISIGFLLAKVTFSAPLFGTAALIAYAVFAAGAVNFVWQQFNQPTQE